jgi:hypothetical protein
MGGEGRHRWEPSANTLAYARIRGLGTGATLPYPLRNLAHRGTVDAAGG